MMSSCNVTDRAPVSEDYLSALSDSERALTILCGVLVLLKLLLFIENLHYVIKIYQKRFLILRTTALLSLYPIVGVCAGLGLLFPRSSLFLDLITSVIISIALYNFVTLIIDHFDGLDNMHQALQKQVVPLGVMPCCCLKCFWLSRPVTKKTLLVVLALGLQCSIVQPLTAILSMVLWLDGKYTKGKLEAHNSYPYLAVPTTLSTILAVYGINLLVFLSKSVLGPLDIKPKLLTLQMVLVLHNFQNLVMSQLANHGIPECRGILSSTVRADGIKHILTVLEMFLLSVVARYLYQRPHLSNGCHGNSESAIMANNASQDLRDDPDDERSASGAQYGSIVRV